MGRVAAIVGLVVLASGALLLAASPAAAAAKVTVTVTGLHCQACPDSLTKDLARLPGVQKVQATLRPAQVVAVLDEQKLPASTFVQAIATHPQLMDPKQTYGAGLVAYIDAPMCAGQAVMCAACPPEETKRLRSVQGVIGVGLDKTAKVATITFAKGAKVRTTDLAAALAKSPYKFTTRFAR